MVLQGDQHSSDSRTGQDAQADSGAIRGQGSDANNVALGRVHIATRKVSLAEKWIEVAILLIGRIACAAHDREDVAVQMNWVTKQFYEQRSKLRSHRTHGPAETPPGITISTVLFGARL